MAENGKTPYEEALEQTVEDAAEDFRARIDGMTEQARQELADLQIQMRELRQEMAERAVGIKDRVVTELQQAASRIREESVDLEDENIAERADAVAEDLESAAEFLEEHTIDELSGEVNEVAKANVWQLVGIAFFVGLIFGLLVAWSKRR